MRRPSTFQLYLVAVALLFTGYVVVEYNQPKPLDWSKTYINKDKIPYGTFVLFDQLPRLLGTDDVVAVRQPIYGQLTGDTETEALMRSGIYPTQTDPTDAEQYEGETSDGEGETQPAEASDSSAASPATEAARDADAPADPATDPAAADESGPDSTDDEPDLSSVEIPLRTENANYLFVNETFEASELEARALLKYVARGQQRVHRRRGAGRLPQLPGRQPGHPRRLREAAHEIKH